MKTSLLRGTALAFLLTANAAFAHDVVIHAGRLIDGVDKTPRANVSILIHDDRITGVENGFVSPAGAEVIDLSKETVLPGLIDCHVHITGQNDGGNPIAEHVTMTDYDSAVRSTAYARNTLLAGFTSVRDVGANAHVVIALKKAIQKGIVEGPRMWVAGPPLGPTGGHSDQSNGLDPELSHPGWDENIVDSPEQARHIVRKLRQEGADLIKIMPSGGVLSIGDDPSKQLMADDEIAAVIQTAHSLGMKVAAHAHGKKAIDAAVRLGIDSIEHGSYADEESYKLMKEHGTYLVPTMLIAQSVVDLAKTHPEQLNPSSAAKALVIGPLIRTNLHRSGSRAARPERARIRADGRRRHETDGCDHRRDRLRRRSHRRHGRHRQRTARPLRRHRRRRRRSARGCHAARTRAVRDERRHDLQAGRPDRPAADGHRQHRDFERRGFLRFNTEARRSRRRI